MSEERSESESVDVEDFMVFDLNFFEVTLGACPPRPYADWRVANAAA
jgi:hypothetical protein